MSLPKRSKKEIFLSLLPLLIFAVVMLVLTLVFLPEIQRLATEEGRAEFKEWVGEIGFVGWLLTLGIQILQVLVAFIPGEPVELMLGFVWGTWLGTLTCLIGVFISTLIIFLAVRRFGRPFVNRIVGEGELEKYRFLSDSVRLDITVFILFFIPGTPKDAITYVVPLTSIHPVKYLLISTFARIPSVVTSTVIGESAADGNYLLTAIVFVITALISLWGIIIGNQYISAKKKNDGK